MNVAITATQKPDLDRDLPARHKPAQDVVPVVVGPEHMAGRRCVVALDYVRVHLVGVVKERPHKAEQHHQDHDGHARHGQLVLREGAHDELEDTALLVDVTALGIDESVVLQLLFNQG